MRGPFFFPPGALLLRLHPALISACAGVLWISGIAAAAAAEPARGLPLSRSYSFHDIGHVPRGSRLSFDEHGRVAVVHEGVYTVLNDSSWLSFVSPDTNPILMSTVGTAPDGRSYFGAAGTVGVAELGGDGKLHPRSLLPADAPAWARAAVFEDLIFVRDGVVFSSRVGLAYWSHRQQRLQLAQVPRVSRVFSLGETIYVSSFDHKLQRLDWDRNVLLPAERTLLDDVVVERAIDLDGTKALVSLLDNRLFLFDGRTAEAWAGQRHPELNGRISSLHRLADGNVAVALVGKGVFILDPSGELLWSLTTPQYHRVSYIASNEPGVLWLATEHSIDMVWYGSGLTTFDQSLGLPVSWPLLARWRDRLFVAADGVLYEGITSAPGRSTQFQAVDPQPPGGAWSLSSNGTHLLTGNEDGIFELKEDGRFERIGHVPNLTYLIMVEGDACFAISAGETALLERREGRWREPARRAAGVPGASVVHSVRSAAWVEMGPGGLVRLSKKEGEIDLMMVRNEEWTSARWVNVGRVGDTVVLSATRELRRFFDEGTQSWCERPQLLELLSRSPYYLARLRGDEEGNIWGTHFEGVVRYTPKDGRYDEETVNFDLINDRYPIVHVLPGNDIWITASQSLCHVETAQKPPGRGPFVPRLVAMMDTRRNAEVAVTPGALRPDARLSYAQNSLAFRFFAGSYTWFRAPFYEYRLRPDAPWSVLETGSLLQFSDLHEGHYSLEVRIGGARSPGAPTLLVPFTLSPPWHRTLPAYLLFFLAAAGAIFGTVRWSTHLARRRNRLLEAVVSERTATLEATMNKLNEETRVSATLAERDRLAGEIHDSVQQGLTGAILQLESTMKLPTLGADLQQRLSVVRNMVSYARQEVQHAVWDVESPLIEENDLGAALEKLTGFVATSDVTPTVSVAGVPRTLPRQMTHHLLRIAQEATTNALRHANPSRVEIQLTYTPDSIRLQITDDGQGFDPQAVLQKVGHFGLRGIRTRTRKLNAELSLESQPSHGTTIRVRVPLPPVTRSE
jgi:signal transduction histidine kinase